MTQPIPEGYHSVQTVIAFKDARKAIEFYKKAFGAKEKFVMEGPGGKGIMHAELQIGDSRLMVGGEMPEKECKSVETYGGSPVSFYVYVENADSFFNKAVAAGAKVTSSMSDAFWGDRVGTVKDPFGLAWTFATHTKDVGPEEMRRAAERFMAHGAGAHA